MTNIIYPLEISGAVLTHGDSGMSKYPVLDFHYHRLMANYHNAERIYYQDLGRIIPNMKDRKFSLAFQKEKYHGSQCSVHFLKLQQLFREEREAQGNIDRLVHIND